LFARFFLCIAVTISWYVNGNLLRFSTE
jgi:hypothetical protein